MKNLPDDELFDALENRLRNYSEQPDEDVWRKIAAGVTPSRKPVWYVWSNRAATLFAVVSFFILLYNGNEVPEFPDKISRPLKRDAPSSDAKESSVPKAADNSQELVPLDSTMQKSERQQTIAARKILRVATVSSLSLPEHVHKTDGNFSVVSNSAMIASDELTAGQTIASDTLQPIHITKEDSVAKVVQKRPIQKERQKRSGITFYTVLTPVLSYHRASPISNDGVVIEHLDSPPVLSNDRLGLSVEAGVQGKITPRLEYVAGLSYYQQSQRITYDQQTSDNVIIEEDADMSYIVRPGMIRKSFTYNMRNIGAQAGLLYALKLDGLVHKAGIVLHYQRGFQTVQENDVYNNAASHYLNYQLLYRVEYAFNQKLNLFIQPSYMHSFRSNESLQAPFSLKQSRAGIGVGLVYRFIGR
jgi:hypothetical protein